MAKSQVRCSHLMPTSMMAMVMALLVVLHHPAAASSSSRNFATMQYPSFGAATTLSRRKTAATYPYHSSSSTHHHHSRRRRRRSSGLEFLDESKQQQQQRSVSSSSLVDNDDTQVVQLCSMTEMAKNLLRGAVLRVASDLSGGTPLESIKCRVTTTLDGPIDATRNIVNDGGIWALWAGTSSRTVEGMFFCVLVD